MEEVKGGWSCEICGSSFVRYWTYQQALDILKEQFPEAYPGDLAIVCDSCFKLVEQVENIVKIRRAEQRLHDDILAYYSIIQLIF